MTTVDVQAMVTEVRDGVRVLRNEAVETRRVLKLLVGVLHDMQSATEGLRHELHHIRTAHERSDRTAQLVTAIDPVSE